MVKKGDTLIEVALAVGIFSMIAISIVSVMSSGTSGAQLALETTLAREEVDVQAETIRFIHNAYSSKKENISQSLSNLWKTITANAIDLSDMDESAKATIVQYTPQSCSEIYRNDNPIYNKAFVINPRTVNEADSKAYISLKNNSDIFTEASTYPRLIFSDNNDASNANSDNSSSLFGASKYKNLYKAEGIYVIAVKDSIGTNIVDIANNPESVAAYYDFYIRTCWYGTGNNEPSTISTVIRLHDSDITEISGYVDVTLGDERGVQKRTFELPEPNTERYAYTFKGWCPKDKVSSDGQSCDGETYPAGTILYNNQNDGVEKYELAEVWEHTKYTIKYYSDHGGEVPSDTICYLDEDCYVSDADLKITGYKMNSWCKLDDSGACSLKLNPGQLIKKAGEDNPSTILPGAFNNNKTLELHANWSEFNEKITLTLTWGETPRDLDSYVYGQKSDSSYFSMYYGSKTYSENFSEPIASLDKDITRGYGPETVTLNTLGGKTYYYYIHNYSRTGNVTGATVTLRNLTTGETRVYNSDNASGSGNYWNVFTYKDGVIIDRNTRSSSPQVGY